MDVANDGVLLLLLALISSSGARDVRAGATTVARDASAGLVHRGRGDTATLWADGGNGTSEVELNTEG